MAHTCKKLAGTVLAALAVSVVASPPGHTADADAVAVSPPLRVAGSGDFPLEVSGTLAACAGQEIYFDGSDFQGAGSLSDFDDRILADDSGAFSGTVRVAGEYYDHPGVLTLEPGCQQTDPSGPVGGSPDFPDAKLLLIPTSVPADAVALEVSSTAVAPGQSLTLRASGLNSFFAFGAALHSTQTLLALGPVAEDGTASATVTIPSSTPLGQHTVLLLGNSDDGLRTFAADIEVRDAEPAPAGPTARSIDDACPTDRVPPNPFTDVITGSTHERAISCLVWWQVANGRTSTTYAPSEGVTRDAMAAFVARAVLKAKPGSLPDDPADAYNDDAGSSHHKAINQLAAVGIVGGTGNGLYSPGAPVSRAQMAKFLALAAEHVLGEPLPTTRDWFSDDNGSPLSGYVNQVADAGLTGGRPDGTYDPSGTVQRAQMGSFLARTLDLFVDNGATPPA